MFKTIIFQIEKVFSDLVWRGEAMRGTQLVLRRIQ